MDLKDVAKAVATLICGGIAYGAQKGEEHQQKVNEYKNKLRRANTSVEQLKAIRKRELITKHNIFSAEAQAAGELLKEKGISDNIN